MNPGETADFNCKVTGEPKPDITWYFNGKQLEHKGIYAMFTENQLQVLEVHDVSPEELGTYTVSAKNPLGEVSCSADLQFEGTTEDIC